MTSDDQPDALASSLSRFHQKWTRARGLDGPPPRLERGPSVQIGGPAYRWSVDVAHMTTIAQVTASAAAGQTRVWLEYLSSAVLALDRCRWLASAVQSEADVAISIDSDCFVRNVEGRAGGDVLLSCAQHLAEADGPIGILLPQGNGRLNAVGLDGERLSPDAMPEPYRLTPVSWVGTGIMIFPLAWYRRVYRERVEPRYAFMFGVPPNNADPRPMRERWADPRTQCGEDYWHCKTVQQVGGTVYAMHVPPAQHVPRTSRVDDFFQPSTERST